MDTFQNDERSAHLAAETSRWMSRLEGGTDEDRAQFAAWLARNPAHLREYMQMAALDEELHRFDPLKKIDVEALMAQATARPVRRDRRFWALAAGLIGFVLVIQLAILAAMPTYETHVGERQLVRLRDGSTIHLNTNTRVRVSFAYGRRTIELAHGEALFDVASDPRHPFVVHTALGSAVAVGTSFGVRREADWMRVTVLEGRVRVSDNQDPMVDRAAVDLVAGEEATVPGAAGAFDMHKPGLNKARKRLAWTQGQLEFFGETLQEAVDEMNRYGTVQIRISDPALARKQVSGTFEVDNPKGFATAVARTFNAVIDEVESRSGDIVIEIKRKKP